MAREQLWGLTTLERGATRHVGWDIGTGGSPGESLVLARFVRAVVLCAGSLGGALTAQTAPPAPGFDFPGDDQGTQGAVKG